MPSGASGLGRPGNSRMALMHSMHSTSDHYEFHIISKCDSLIFPFLNIPFYFLVIFRYLLFTVSMSVKSGFLSLVLQIMLPSHSNLCFLLYSLTSLHSV